MLLEYKRKLKAKSYLADVFLDSISNKLAFYF